MKGTICLVLAACVGVSLAVPSSPSSSSSSSSSSSQQKQDDSKVLMKRDYKAPVANTPAQGGYPPADNTDNGYYYYYYPVEEDGHGKKVEKKEKCFVEKVMIPLILMTIFLGIIAANSLNLIPTINLPPITLPAIPIHNVPVVGGIGKRDVSGSAYDYVPWGSFEKLTTSVMDAIESEECLSRLVCESGRYAEGRTVILSLLEFLTPSKYHGRMKIFKDSALKKSDCSNFKCSYLGEKKL